jgi:hypothetical protein
VEASLLRGVKEWQMTESLFMRKIRKFKSSEIITQVKTGRPFGFGVLGAACFALSAGTLSAASDGLPRGCHEMPYVRYEAENGMSGSGAVSRTAFDFNPETTASEASNQHYIGLPVNGSYVQWAVSNAADGVALRFTLPDNATGAGVTGSLHIYVNGTYSTNVNLGSYWAWTYFVSSNPQNTPGARPRMRFDEIHFRLPSSLRPGDVLKIVKANGDAYEYGIDFVEIESIPAALTQPSGYVNVTTYGANGSDSFSDTTAFNNAWAAAKSAGTGLYIPPGKYILSSQWSLGDSSGISIQGAGIWHTELFFSTKAVGAGGIFVGENTSRLNISHLYMNSALNERHIVAGQVSNYKAFNGCFGSNSSIRNVWLNHFEAGVWMGDYTSPIQVTTGFEFVSNRVRNTYADGINFAQGSSSNTVRQCSFRDTGDDSMAVWTSNSSGAPEGHHNRFYNNTVEFTYRAGSVGIFGGYGHEIHHNILKDGIESSGIRFTEDFSGYNFTNNTGIYIYENSLIARGTSLDLWNMPRGAIEISGAGVRNLYFENNTISNSPRHAIQLRGGQSLFFTNTIISTTGLDNYNSPGGAAIRQYELGGNASFTRLVTSGIENNPEIIQETQDYTLTINNLFPVTDRSSLIVQKGGTATFGVRPSFQPSGTVTVLVSRVSGDTNISVQAGSTLFFNASNWTNYQTVTLAAGTDPDGTEASAVIQCSAVDYESTTLIATEFDPQLNHVPSAANDMAETYKGVSVAINVLTNDSDPDSDLLVIQSASNGSNGGVSFTASQATYTPNSGFHGADAFTYVVSDGRGGTATGQVAVTVHNIVVSNPYGIEIRFNGYGRSESLSNFPVLVKLSTAITNFSYSQFASPLGYDLRFTNATGRELNYEIESWDTNSTSYVWVQVPTLTNSARIWATWGAAANSEQPEYTTNGATWSGNYAGVYHAGGSGVRRDSTLNRRDGTVFGNTTNATGLIAGADAFDGDYDYVEIPSTFGLFNGTVNVTVEFWFKADKVAPSSDYQTSPVLFQGRGENAWMMTFGDGAPSNTLSMRLNQGGWVAPVSRSGIQTGRWYYCSTTYAPSGANNWKMFMDGFLVSQSRKTGSVSTEVDKNAYGGNAGEIARWFDGTMDEVRISSVARSSNWLWATWMNVVSNGAFATYGSAVGPPSLNETILVDFGNNSSWRGYSTASPDSNGNYWNSVDSSVYWSSLIDISNNMTTVNLGFDAVTGTDSYNGPAGVTAVTGPGNASTSYTNAVIDATALGSLGAKEAAFDYYTSSSFQIQGLDPTRRYSLTFFGSHKYSTDSATVYSVYSDSGYTSLVASASLNVQVPGSPWLHNSNQVVTITNLLPQTGNVLYVKYAGSGRNEGYLNALKINSQPTNGRWTFSSSAGTGGSVIGSSNGSYSAGSLATVAAQPVAYYHWGYWNGDVPADRTNSNPLTLTMDQDRAIAAVFIANITTNGVPEYWLASYGWTNNFDAASLTDTDGDGLSAWKEYKAGTDPTNSASVLRIKSAPIVTNSGIRIVWSSVTGKMYRIERSTNLLSTSWFVCASNISATPPENTSTQNLDSLRSAFYKIRLEE